MESFLRFVATDTAATVKEYATKLDAALFDEREMRDLAYQLLGILEAIGEAIRNYDLLRTDRHDMPQA